MNMSNNKLILSASPHLHSGASIKKIMAEVGVALLPAAGAAVFFFGLRALLLMAALTATAILAELATLKMLGKPARLKDGSAAITGLLLAFILPPTYPLWMGMIGVVIAITVTKHLFGGLGFNLFNPALAARAALLASWPVATTTWIKPLPLFSPQWWGCLPHLDAITSATPLGILQMQRNGELLNAALPGYWELFLGQRGGCLGETCVLALLIGAIYLLWKKVITWQIPFSYLGTVMVLSALLGKDPFFHLLAGGLVLGAFFMATDYVTAPVTPKGKIIFGAGCGILTVLIRLYGGFPEGVNYAILLMNIGTPLLDKYTQPRVYGK
jgi:electron transport complex protein RnfD